jgi:hypothetical protein
MEQNRRSIGGEANVELDPATIELVCPAQTRKRVLGRAGRDAAMPNYPR